MKIQHSLELPITVQCLLINNEVELLSFILWLLLINGVKYEKLHPPGSRWATHLYKSHILHVKL